MPRSALLSPGLDTFVRMATARLALPNPTIPPKPWCTLREMLLPTGLMFSAIDELLLQIQSGTPPPAMQVMTPLTRLSALGKIIRLGRELK